MKDFEDYVDALTEAYTEHHRRIWMDTAQEEFDNAMDEARTQFETEDAWLAYVEAEHDRVFERENERFGAWLEAHLGDYIEYQRERWGRGDREAIEYITALDPEVTDDE